MTFIANWASIAALALALVPLPAKAQSAAPAPENQQRVSNYRIAPGDLVDIRVLGEDQMSKAVRVSNAGTIRVPFVADELVVQCRTESEVAADITERLRKYLKKPEVFVAVTEFVGSPVAIIGAVAQPGKFQLQRQISLLELLVFAGGPSDKAGRVVHVISSNSSEPCAIGSALPSEVPDDAPSVAISLAKLLNGDVSQNRILRAGDIVVVPQADLVFVAGEVFKPNAYTLREGLTLTQLMALAGGPTNVAKLDAVRIVRQEPGKAREEIPASLNDIQSGKMKDPFLLANDVVEVPGSTGKKIFNSVIQTIGGSIGQLPVRAVP